MNEDKTIDLLIECLEWLCSHPGAKEDLEAQEDRQEDQPRFRCCDCRKWVCLGDVDLRVRVHKHIEGHDQ